MSPSASASTDNNTKPLPGHVGNLTIKETDMLKKMWARLIDLFKQKGTEYKAIEKKEETIAIKKSGWFSKKESNTNENKDLFIGATKDPSWLSLPLERALPLIPGKELRSTFWSMVATDNPDAVILRFLRARKWDLDAAYNMLVNTLRWRLVMRLDDILALGENGLRDELNQLKPKLGDCFITQLNSGKAYLGGPDKAGRGICFINVCLHHKEDQPMEIIKLLTMYIMETSRVVVHQPVEAACIVFNMEGFTLKNMDFDFVKFLLTCFEAYYPETLGSCLIHKAPWVFSTIWHLITPLLDPVVASKIHFTKDVKELSNYVDVSALPAIITGDKDKKTLDESIKVDPVAPGTLEEPTTVAYQEYQEMIHEYLTETDEWIKTQSTENDSSMTTIRREFARQYRLARIKAELDIRGPTSYQAKGLVTINNEGRIILDYSNDGWVPLDITEMV
ncbi:CRAL-TRIO domain-containing protein [Cokeromyces recurvatus]|uniref:CRAL-TRIO domain-containing protein n=1 Tax=Cokeromyces recurvatus TaxID=90255 RepID=UPI00221EC3A6|nr:CRAL-TRIO domain-containing protein [Cokeromyces recurvatus]KAI7907545.1 CRAL-TRIO domain-containing protein [Cokeromyces recurvatus]